MESTTEINKSADLRPLLEEDKSLSETEEKVQETAIPIFKKHPRKHTF